MADWRWRSIAGGPSPPTPKKDVAGALHLDFFPLSSADGMDFPCDRAGAGGSGEGSSKNLEAVIMLMRWSIREIADEALLLPGGAVRAHGSLNSSDFRVLEFLCESFGSCFLADDRNGGDRRMAEEPPATMAPPLQPHKCQPAGTATTGGRGLDRGDSRRRVNCPSYSQLPPLPEHATVTNVYIEEASDDEEPGEEEEEEEEEEEVMMSEHRDDEEEANNDDEEKTMSSSGHSNDDDQEDEDEEEEEDDDDEEEEEEEPCCVDCSSTEGLVKLIPCRHASYCQRCFNLSRERNEPSICPTCREPYKRAHPQYGRLQPKPKPPK